MSAPKSKGFTPGPWTWNEGNYSLYPVNPDPDHHSVYTIIGPDGCFGFMCAKLQDVLDEDEANKQLIQHAPDLYDALATLIGALHVQRVSLADAIKQGIEALHKASPRWPL